MLTQAKKGTITIMVAAAAFAALAMSAGPAAADDGWGHRGWHEGHRWHPGWYRPRVEYVAPGYVYAPPPVVYAPPPQVMYAPPPVVYAPPPMAPSFNVVIPIR
jgi:hypothetical protein